jgi:hypothetical protein
MESVRLHHWLSRLFGFHRANNDLQPGLTTQRLAVDNGIDRRKAARIHYPEQGALGDLPEIHYLGHPMRIHDISLGGTCLIDDLDFLQGNAGNNITLDLVWRDLSVPQACLIVAVGFNKRHIRFLDLDTQSYVRLTLLLKPGYLGMRMRRLNLDGAHHIQVGAEEMWVGTSGEAITAFPRIDANFPLGEITLYGRTVLIYEKAPPLYKQQYSDGLPGQRIREALLHDLLIFAVNVRNPTETLKELINCLTDAYLDYQRNRQ